MTSFTEENYLKAIYFLSRSHPSGVATNAIAKRLETKASSVTDMLKKLALKGMINYQKYQGVTLTDDGQRVALLIIRKHRLWEVFMVEKLNFKWDEVHEIAEQLEHIDSAELVDRLDQFLEFPKFDPHGDPIPDREGNVFHHKDQSLADLDLGELGVVVGVKDSSASFLQHLETIGLVLGCRVEVKEVFSYDQSMLIILQNEKEYTVSAQVSRNLYVKKNLK